MDRADLPPTPPATRTRQAHPDRVRTAPHTSRNRGLKITPRESTELGAVPAADFTDWLLFDQFSPSIVGRRGLATGTLYNRSGELVCIATQEGYFAEQRQ
ncbi:hypothetical protein [Mycobacterium intracellulare]|uniref:hypothetical protein n=1 Tax=Mycobacterium intracellulare TaxID=1767 RepID=UPI002D807D15|nr:hypothetical protein [Mycobacterium intracellulare]